MIWLVIGLVFVNLMLLIRLFGILYLRKKSAQKFHLIRSIEPISQSASFLKKISYLLIVSFVCWGILSLIRVDMLYAVGIAMGIAMAFEGLFSKEKQS